MSQKVSEVYSELYHYTTAIGLQGIVSSQTIRATHYEYVNDTGEFKSYFKDRLPLILHDCVGAALKQAYESNPIAKKVLDETGGLEISTERIEEELARAMTTAAQTTFEPYLSSFCGAFASNVINDGLLSQWRGYGSDGGYAIVFDAKAIEELLIQEAEERHYYFIMFADVDYYDHRIGDSSKLEEMHMYEEQIKAAITKYILSTNKDDLDDTVTPLMGMSGAHKHIGFSEEAEVRIMAIPMTKADFNELEESGGKDKKPVEYDFYIRNGILVPFISLFQGKKLPIKRILIGPHSDRERRKKSVLKLLAKYDIDAEVIVSEIPYAGK